jgi:class 3 adenylate cyclase
MEYTAIGNCVNLASRLQGKANPWEILVDSEIHHELVGSGHKLEERSITLKGMEGPISAWSFKLQSEIKTS